jgi:hypothetical protein
MASKLQSAVQGQICSPWQVHRGPLIASQSPSDQHEPPGGGARQMVLAHSKPEGHGAEGPQQAGKPPVPPCPAVPAVPPALLVPAAPPTLLVPAAGCPPLPEEPPPGWPAVPPAVDKEPPDPPADWPEPLPPAPEAPPAWAVVEPIESSVLPPQAGRARRSAKASARRRMSRQRQQDSGRRRMPSIPC